MNKNLEMQLVKDFPKLFIDYGGDMTQTCMTWGCEHNDGWYNILRDMCAKLEPLVIKWVAEYPDKLEMTPRFAQVKEKFGTLRVYLSSGTDEMHKIVDEAEEKSVTTCETCGAPDAKLRGRNWVYTACIKCTKPEDFDNFEYIEEEVEKRKEK